MGRIGYLFAKVVTAWSSGTLREKASRFLVTSVRRPVEVLFGYLRLAKADRNLNIEDGFADHRENPRHHRSDPEHLRRIVAAYKAAKRAQPGAAAPFEIRGLWAEWIAVNYKALIGALESEDLDALARLFENLFREQCTIGTGGYDNWVRYRSPLGSFYIKYVWSSYRDKLLALDFDPRDVRFPLVGNQTGVLLEGTVVSIETLRHAYHAVEISRLLKNVADPVCVEIGGGLGGQTYQTMQLCGGRIAKYLLFDIPEVAALSSYFLLSAFPDKRVRLFGEGPLSVSPAEEYDIAVLPHFSITRLPDASVDLFYNSCSFSEMDGVSSREYLAVIERAGRNYFMHDNHETRLEFKNPDGSTSTNAIGSELVPDPALFEELFKKPRVHGLPEDRSFRQFEYLYRRIPPRR
jgi:putative sugar O-methyltransferase